MHNKPFIPYSCQSIDKTDIDAVIDTLRADFITCGPKVAAFESDLARFCHTDHSIAVANGTAALHIACLAIGLKEGDEVITTPNTFVATSNAILYCRATPVFADIDLQTGQLDLNCVKQHINPKTKAIITVDFAGASQQSEHLYALATKNKLTVIQDASHSLGARYNGHPIGSNRYADITTFSFHPVKPITTGEGGAITTNNPRYAQACRQLRGHGINKSAETMENNEGPWFYEMHDLGFNYRITDLQCALGQTQLKRLPEFIEKRHHIAAQYEKAFQNVEHITPLLVPNHCFHGYHLYVVLIDFNALKATRTEIMLRLKEQGIGTQVHYIPVYAQPYYKKNVAKPAACPNMDAYYQRALSLPLYPSMSQEDISRVITAV